MSDIKKEPTIDDVVNKSATEIISYFQSHTGKNFKTRIGKINEFHNPKYEIINILSDHVESIVQGNPDDRKKFPGAYNVAYEMVTKFAKGRFDRVNKLDDATAIIEAYVDQFLKQAHESKFDEAMKKAKAEGLDAESIRNMKGELFSMYHVDPQTGRGLNPFEPGFVKGYVGKTRMGLVKRLKSLAQTSQQRYTQYLASEATSNLVRQTDHVDLASHVHQEIYKKAGLTHPEHPLTKRFGTNLEDYVTYLSAGDMKERGFEGVGEQRAKAEAKKGGGGAANAHP